MTAGKNKDIVEEVFSRSMKVDDRVSALFTYSQLLPQVLSEKDRKISSDPKESLAAKDIGSSDNKLFQSAKGAKHKFFSKRTFKNNKELVHQVTIVVVAGLLVSVFAFFFSSYFVQGGHGSTKMMLEKQYVNSSEIVSLSEKQPLPNVRPESVSGKINKNITALNWQHVINWSSLLSEISATIPKTIQLSVLESGDGSEMFLEGNALSADAVNNFVDALGTNKQIKSAELTKTSIGKGELQDMLTFSISCCLVSDTKTPGSVDGGYNNSGFDRSGLFTPKEAEKFFGSIQPGSKHRSCMVKSLLVSTKDSVFEDEKTNSHITKKHAVLTLLGGYQNILKEVEKLQNHSQGVWFDSVSIKQSRGTGGLECRMGISVYVAEGTE